MKLGKLVERERISDSTFFGTAKKTSNIHFQIRIWIMSKWKNVLTKFRRSKNTKQTIFTLFHARKIDFRIGNSSIFRKKNGFPFRNFLAKPKFPNFPKKRIYFLLRNSEQVQTKLRKGNRFLSSKEVLDEKFGAPKLVHILTYRFFFMKLLYIEPSTIAVEMTFWRVLGALRDYWAASFKQKVNIAWLEFFHAEKEVVGINYAPAFVFHLSCFSCRSSHLAALSSTHELCVSTLSQTFQPTLFHIDGTPQNRPVWS